MAGFLSFFIILALAITTFKFFTAHNSFEKIISFYFIFTNFIILLLINAVTNFDAMLDIIIILFLLQFVTVLFLLINRKKT